MENPSAPEDHEPPDLSLQYRMQVYFPEPDEKESWDTINSFSTPVEALRGCSECLETVKDLLEIPYGQNLENAFVRIRVWDAEAQKLLLWEDEDGELHADASVFHTADTHSQTSA